MSFFLLKLLAAGLATGALIRLAIPTLHDPRLRLLAWATYFTRFAWLPGLALAVVWLLGHSGASHLLGALFVVPPGRPFAVVGFLAVMAAAAAWAGGRVCVVNGPSRFPDVGAVYHAAAPRPISPAAVAVLGGLTVLLSAALLVAGCLYDAHREAAGEPWAVTVENAGWAAVGFGGAFLGLAGLALVEARVFLPAERIPHLLLFRFPTPGSPGRLGGWVAREVRKRLIGLGPGFAQPSAVLAPGHGPMAVFAAAVAVVYAGMFATGRFGPPGVIDAWIPAIASILLMVTLASLLGPAAGFYLDFHRVPVTVVVVAVSLALFWLNDADHYYYVDPGYEPAAGLLPFVLAGSALVCTILALWGPGVWPRVAFGGYAVGYLCAATWWGGAPSEPVAPVGRSATLVTVSESWKLLPAWPTDYAPPNGPADNPDDRVLVVVAVSGGGIQASAWAARVLTGLDERYGPRFTRSVRLISAVSGGCLGTAAYLSRWRADAAQDQSPFPKGEADREEINRVARLPGLAATAWGTAFPDFVRFGFPAAVPDHIDRGWALESRWRDEFQVGAGRDWRLRHVGEAAAAGKGPVVVFNATLAETGRRLLINSNPIHSGGLTRAPEGVEYLDLFPDGGNIRMATAVRLSATFPFISPLSRARCRQHYDFTRPGFEYVEDPHLHTCHVADGGYVDNGGVFTATKAIQDLARYYHNPEEEWQPGREPPFQRVVLLRIIPFPSTGDAPGREYSKNGWLNEFVGPVTTLTNVRTTSQAERNTSLIQVVVTGISVPVTDVPFYFPKGSDVIPLSWSLTRRQGEAIDAGWEQYLPRPGVLGKYPLEGVDANPLRKLDALFGAPR